jgi:hypothetical protein
MMFRVLTSVEALLKMKHEVMAYVERPEGMQKSHGGCQEQQIHKQT